MESLSSASGGGLAGGGASSHPKQVGQCRSGPWIQERWERGSIRS